MKIIKAKKQDIAAITRIASLCFSGMRDIKKARKWIGCNFAAFPRLQYYVAKQGRDLFGYILWLEKGGFREQAVLELEQIAVHPEFRGKGIGSRLIADSLAEIKASLQKRGSLLKLVEVTTGTENPVQRLYKKTLDAKVEAVIKDFFRGDEAIMIARPNSKLKIKNEKLQFKIKN
jgi:ribosomal protein S18 acetylase RimI-like enzyme